MVLRRRPRSNTWNFEYPQWIDILISASERPSSPRVGGSPQSTPPTKEDPPEGLQHPEGSIHSGRYIPLVWITRAICSSIILFGHVSVSIYSFTHFFIYSFWLSVIHPSIIPSIRASIVTVTWEFIWIQIICMHLVRREHQSCRIFSRSFLNEC